MGLRERMRGAVKGWRGTVQKPVRAQRAYSGAAISRLFASWITPLLSANQAIEPDLRRLRDRSRALCRDNPHAKAFLNLLRTNVIGPSGIELKSLLTSSRGNVHRGNRDLELAFYRWGHPSTASADGRHSWIELQQLAVTLMAQDGEFLARRRRGVSGNRFGYTLQLLDPDQLDETYTQAPAGGRNAIRMGVEHDTDGRAVAYHVWRHHPAEGGREFSGNERIPVPADEIVHLFVAERPGQVRGVPWFAPVLRNLKHLDDWRENAVVAARIGAAKMGFFVDKEGLGGGGADVGDTDGAGTAPNRLTMDIEAGMFGELPPGYEFQSFDPGYPNIEYEAFERAILRAIAAGLGVSYSALTGDLREVNYSSDRSGRIAERDLYRTLHGFLITKLCGPVYADWLSSATASKALRPPTFDLDLLEQSATWQGRGWQWVDPRADVLSIKEQIALGLFSRTAACTEMGRDFPDIIEQLKAEQALADEAGVSVAGLTSQGESAKGGTNDDSSAAGTTDGAGGDAESDRDAHAGVRLLRHG